MFRLTFHQHILRFRYFGGWFSDGMEMDIDSYCRFMHTCMYPKSYVEITYSETCLDRPLLLEIT